MTRRTKGWRWLGGAALFAAIAAGAPPAAAQPKPPRTLAEAKRLHDAAEKELEKGDVRGGQADHEAALSIREALLSKDDLAVAESLHDLGVARILAGRYADARPLLERALAIREKRLAPSDVELASTVGDVAAVLFYLGDLDGAAARYARAIAIAEKAGDAAQPKLATLLDNEAALHGARGDTTKSAELHRRALAIREKHFGPDDPLVAASLHNVGVADFQRGDLIGAEEKLARALAIREKVRGPKHPEVAASAAMLGTVYDERGDTARAEKLLRRAIDVWEASIGPDRPNVATARHNLGMVYIRQGNDARAIDELQKALAIRKKAFGDRDRRVAETETILAGLLASAGQHDLAIELGERVAATYEATGAGSTIAMAIALENLASAYEAKGDRKRAIAALERAVRIEETAVGPRHASLAHTLAHLSLAEAAGGRVPGALAAMRRAAEIEEANLALLVSVGSESQKRAYAATLPFATGRVLTLHLVHAPKDPEAARLAALTLLRRKGRVLDAEAGAMRALRRRLDPDAQGILDELTATRSRLAAVTLGAAPPGAAGAAGAAALADAADALEAKLAKASAVAGRAARPVTLENVLAHVPKDAALIELATWDRPVEGNRVTAPRYVAYVLRPGAAALAVDLGDAAGIDALVARARKSLASPASTDVREIARSLDEQVMRPVRPLLGGARRLVVAPAGALALVPFGALVDEDGQWLVERYAISYVTSGRDLLMQDDAAPARGEPVVVAAPDFGARGEAADAAGVLARVTFPPLSGTREEADALAKVWPKATVLTGADATEAAVRAVHAPRVLHLATHGFFLGGDAGNGAGKRALVLEGVAGAAPPAPPNPLLGSGVALAGANQHASAADASGAHDDGVLTATEAAGLDLVGTKLVVLSACETGIGRVDGAEGVTGLRRALVIAGAEAVVMSLWKVDDAATRDLMVAYHRELAKGGGRSESLRSAELALLASPERRHPYYWASFIASGDWRSLDGADVAVATPQADGGFARAPGGACGCDVPGGAPAGRGVAMAAIGLLALAVRSRRRAAPSSRTSSVGLTPPCRPSSPPSARGRRR